MVVPLPSHWSIKAGGSRHELITPVNPHRKRINQMMSEMGTTVLPKQASVHPKKGRSLHMFFKQAYGNMSCPRHIGEGQEVQEHQGT